MNGDPDFLTSAEVAELMRVKVRRVYDLAAANRIPNIRRTGRILFPRRDVERWLAAGGEGGVAAPAPASPVIAGSHDPLLEWAVRESGAGLALLFDGSEDGLARFGRGQAQAAAIHLFDPPSESWNIEAARAQFSARPVALIGWAARRRGLLLGSRFAAATAVEALRGARLAVRQPASGAAGYMQWLFESGRFDAALFAPAEGEPARTETDAALAISSGAADVAPGVEASARQFGLGFLPLIEERVDLLVDRRAYFDAPLQTLLAFSRGPQLAQKAAALGGYDVSDLGRARWCGG